MEKKEYEEILAGEDLGNWLCKVSREHPKVARVDICIIADGNERLTRGFDMQSVRIFPRFLNVRCRPSRKLTEAICREAGENQSRVLRLIAVLMELQNSLYPPPEKTDDLKKLSGALASLCYCLEDAAWRIRMLRAKIREDEYGKRK